MSDELAIEIFGKAHNAFRSDEDEDKASKGEIVPEGLNYWFVGAAWDDGDQTRRFLSDRIWQNGYEDKFSNLVRQMKQGDKIAIKATYTRKNDVPFENRGRTVSAMRIKAIGTITHQWQEILHGERNSESWPEALPDFVKLAEAFGAKGILCKDNADLDDAIQEMLDYDGPMIPSVSRQQDAAGRGLDLGCDRVEGCGDGMSAFVKAAQQ